MTVVDLTGGDRDPDPHEPESDASNRLRPLLLSALALAGAAIGAAFLTFAEPDREPTPASAPPPQDTTLVPAPDIRSPDEGALSPGDGALDPSPSPEVVEFEPLAGVATMSLHAASNAGGWVIWQLDLAGGLATPLRPDPTLDLESIADLRLFAGGVGLAVLADERTLVLLQLDDDTVTVTRRISIGDRDFPGLDAVTPDGTSMWVSTRFGFIRWRLADDEITARWLDLDGDLGLLPNVGRAIDAGLAVTEGGRTFLLDENGANPLSTTGDILGGDGTWLVTRLCDDALRCATLRVTDTTSGSSYDLSDSRYIDHCGSVTALADGSAMVALQHLGSSAVVTLAPDGSTAVEPTPVHPGSIGCIHVMPTPTEESVAAIVHERGVTVLYADGSTAFRQLPALRPLVSAG